MFVIMDEAELRRIASKIVYDLFTNGCVQRGDFMVVKQADDQHGFVSPVMLAAEVETMMVETMSKHWFPKPMPIPEISKRRRELKANRKGRK